MTWAGVKNTSSEASLSRFESQLCRDLSGYDISSASDKVAVNISREVHEKHILP